MKIKTLSYEPIQSKICLAMLWFGRSLVLFSLFAAVVQAKGTLPVIVRITLLSEPPALQIQLDRPAPFRAVRVASRKVRVAFNGVKLSKKLLKQGEGGPRIREVKTARLKNNVVALTVSTDQDVGKIQTVWDESVNTLTVGLFPGNSENPAPQKAATSLEPATVLPTPASGAPMAQLLLSPSLTDKTTGSEDDLLLKMDGTACPEQIKFQDALRQCGKKNWREAFQLLHSDLQSGQPNNCKEKAYYLRAYAYYKLNQQGDEGLYLEALTYFQDAGSYFPDSVYAPYALTSMGKIYKELKNYAEAKGYFKMILEKYKDYPGRPEVMFKLGQIYGLEKNMRMSIPIFKDILSNFPENHFAIEAKLELGKALYSSNQYSQALELLNDVLAKEPRRAFDLEDVLLVIGNSYYQIGNFQESRDALIRAFNLFPKSDINPITLTRIGDIFRDTGQPDKANKIYRIVMDRFAGTDGSVIAAMRRAALLEERTEKENIYRMVMKDYPKHPMASLAVVKLSDLQYKSGEYRNSI